MIAKRCYIDVTSVCHIDRPRSRISILPGWRGQVFLGGDTSSRLFGVTASLLIHGAMLGVLMLMPIVRPGAPSTGEQRMRVFDVQIVSSGDTIGASRNGSVDDAPRSRPALALSREKPPPPPELISPIRAAGSDVGADEAVPQRPISATSTRQASANDGALRSNYQSALFAHVLRYRFYPEEARADRLRGVVRVQFALSRDGRILSAWVQTGSGFPVLDEAALEALRRAQPLPAIPPELPGEMEVLLPLDYVPPRMIRAG